VLKKLATEFANSPLRKAEVLTFHGSWMSELMAESPNTIMGTQRTVKALNFGTHVNFELFSLKGLLSSKRVLQEMKKMKVVENL
jgi:hypothetical protein